jgi:synaptic vesicle membrane protein VAT-1
LKATFREALQRMQHVDRVLFTVEIGDRYTSPLTSGGGRMRAVYVTRTGGCDVLEVRVAPEPAPAAGELAIRVRAAGINFADLLARQGIYPAAPRPPCVLGYEVAGTVIAAGSGADRGWIGKDVLALTNFGGQAEVACVDAAFVWEKPGSLSFEQAAAIPENYVTAWTLLVAMGGLDRGETVLVHNAGGGVGLAALDVALHRGATVIGTASPRKHGFLRERGCHHCVDYSQADWPAQVRALTGGRGVELAIDPIGGSSWKRSFSVLRKGGRLGMFGISAAATGGGLGAKLALLKLVLGMPRFHPLQLIPANRGVFGVQMHAMLEEPGKIRRALDAVLRGVGEGWVRPHVDRVFRFEEAPAAHAHIEARANIGKVLLVP